MAKGIIIIIVIIIIIINNNNNDKRKQKEINIKTLQENKKKLWNLKVIVVSIVVGVPGTIPKGLIKGLEDLEIRGQLETIQTTVLLRSDRIVRRVMETWGDLSFKLK